MKSYEEQSSHAIANLMNKLTQLERQIQSERIALIGEKLEKNSLKVQAYVADIKTLTESRNDLTVVRSNDAANFLSLRMVKPLCKVSGLAEGSADKDAINNSRENTSSEDIAFSATAKLPLVEKLLPYTTWIFLDRNHRMADDQSVVGRRRIYYDQHGSEALICSDSEEELGGLEGEKHEFSEAEDRILRRRTKIICCFIVLSHCVFGQKLWENWAWCGWYQKQQVHYLSWILVGILAQRETTFGL